MITLEVDENVKLDLGKRNALTVFQGQLLQPGIWSSQDPNSFLSHGLHNKTADNGK